MVRTIDNLVNIDVDDGTITGDLSVSGNSSLSTDVTITGTSSNALVVENAGGTDVLKVDTSTPQVKITGNAADLFVVENASGTDVFSVNAGNVVSGTVGWAELAYNDGARQLRILGPTTQVATHFIDSSGVYNITHSGGSVIFNIDEAETFTFVEPVIISQTNDDPVFQIRDDVNTIFNVRTTTGNQQVESSVNVLVDVSSTEALLIRKDGDTGDIFNVDTSNDVVNNLAGFQTSATRTDATTSITLAVDDYLVNFSSTSATTINLPAASSVAGSHFVIHKTGASGTGTITPNGGDTIDGAASLALSTQYDKAHLLSDGVSNWLIL